MKLLPKYWRPIIFENSRVPLILEKIAPIKIAGICLGPFVFFRGVPNTSNIRHEVVHFQQQLETGFIGFAILYLWDYLLNKYWHKMPGREAYLQIRAEKEARQSAWKPNYFENRKRYQWIWKRWKK